MKHPKLIGKIQMLQDVCRKLSAPGTRSFSTLSAREKAHAHVLSLLALQTFMMALTSVMT